jgi:pimeloyl-ACP methyl ester carboxylesterase
MATKSPSSRHRATLPVNGVELYYEVHGDGSPLLLLHWYTGTGHIWEPFRAEFAQEYQLIIPDLRGHGRSTNPTGHFTHRQVAADIFALLDHLQILHCKAIGISSGAEVLLHMTTQQPARVTAMVLVGTEIYYSAQARAMYREINADSAFWDWNDLRQHHVHGDEQIRALLDQFQEFADNYDDMHFTPPHLATVAAQTLVVQGDRDAYNPISVAVELYTSIPNAYLWVVPNGDHIPIFGSRQAAFVQTSLEFLRGAWQSSSNE